MGMGSKAGAFITGLPEHGGKPIYLSVGSGVRRGKPDFLNVIPRPFPSPALKSTFPAWSLIEKWTPSNLTRFSVLSSPPAWFLLVTSFTASRAWFAPRCLQSRVSDIAREGEDAGGRPGQGKPAAAPVRTDRENCCQTGVGPRRGPASAKEVRRLPTTSARAVPNKVGPKPLWRRGP